VSQVVQVIGNPSAGRHKARLIDDLVRAFEELGATVHYTECGQSPPPIREDATHVCVAAGDGTVRHVASEVARGGHPVALSIYPAGTINLLAREAGYLPRARDFAELVLSAAPRRRHYPVTIGDGYFFACAGVGPDSFAVARVSSRLKRAIGRLAYGVAFLGLLLEWPRHRIVLSCGDGEIECEAFYVAKGRYYAGPWSFAPKARLDEPLLHVVALRTARRRDYARFVWALFRGGDFAALTNVAILTCTSLRAAAGSALPIQADGDIVGALPATLTVSETPLIFC
jgi:diacylglycerol kinase family enzyme